jgi:hypothetical protein
MEDRLFDSMQKMWGTMNRRQKAVYLGTAAMPLPLALFLVNLHIPYIELYMVAIMASIFACVGLYRKRKFGKAW